MTKTIETEKPIEWDEESEPVKCLLKVSRLFQSGAQGSYHATVDDLRRACEAAGLTVCDCDGEPSLAGAARIDYLEAALKELGRGRKFADKDLSAANAALHDANKDRQELRAEVDRLQRCVLEGSESHLTQKCVALVLTAPECEDAGEYVLEATELAAEVVAAADGGNKEGANTATVEQAAATHGCGDE